VLRVKMRGTRVQTQKQCSIPMYLVKTFIDYKSVQVNGVLQMSERIVGSLFKFLYYMFILPNEMNNWLSSMSSSNSIYSCLGLMF
jgi:hypothetical protein